MSATWQARASALAILLCASACGSPGDGAGAGAGATLDPLPGLGLQRVPAPDFATMEASVASQMRTAHAALRERIGDSGATARELSRAYGEMASLLMAARDLPTAEPYFRNALALDPSDRRWAYYLGHLYRNKGPLSEAATSFEHARELDPDDVATLVWLGDTYLALGRPDDARPLLARAVDLDADSAAAWYGAGRAALAAGEHRAAVEALERALALNPVATATHYPLGLAWRGLGERERAERHLTYPGSVEVQPADPLMTALDDLLQSAPAYEARGRHAFDAGQWAAAADLFERALVLDPENAGLRYRLGTSLWRMGDPRGAEDHLERVDPQAPEFSNAQIALGEVFEASGRSVEAVERLAAAVERDPDHMRARVALAGVLGRNGQPQEALAEYAGVPDEDPARPDAAFGQAMNLIRLERYDEAREQLERAAEDFPDQRSRFTHPLARLLAAAPDDRVRDGGRALAIVEGLAETEQSLLLGETLAMALAEVGRFGEAETVQRDLIAAASQTGLRDAGVLAANLRRYERGLPCRRPWTPDELP